MQYAYDERALALQIRDFPDSLHRMLVDRAKQERRTIAQEATVLLAEALTASNARERRRAVLEQLNSGHHKRLDFSRVIPPGKLIRADRDR